MSSLLSALIPRFKLQWLPNTERLGVEAWLKAEFENGDTTENENEGDKVKVNDFFFEIF